ncbi:MAG: TIGR04255 family protein [Pseudoxanthomonas sp.]
MVVKTGFLKNSPLVMVLAAVRFQPIELTHKWIPEIQEALRDKLPIFSKYRQRVTPVGPQIEIDPSDFDSMDPTSSWLFSRPDYSLTAQVGRDMLVVHTKSYKGSKQFLGDIAEILGVLLGHARHLDVTFGGMRYLDHLRPQNDHVLEDYLPEKLLPLKSWHLDAKFVGGVNVASYLIGADRLQARVFVGEEFAVIPDDLMPVYFTGVDVKRLNQGQVFVHRLQPGEASLDMDCFAALEQAQRSGTSEVIELLDRLHAKANLYFRTVCTDTAFLDWGGGR